MTTFAPPSHRIVRTTGIALGVIRIAIGLIGISAVGLVAAAADSTKLMSTTELNSFVNQYCVDCHRGDQAEASFDLAAFDASLADAAAQRWDTAHWELILKRLVSRQMPPVDADRPSEGEYDRAIEYLSWALDENSTRFPDPGNVETIRRLTRAEYQNSIRDLLHVDVDVTAWLPADESSHGFDNITVGTLSPTLLNRYITAAENISRIAMGGRQRSPGGTTIRIPADRTQEKHVEGLPLGTRGGAVVHEHFAQTGEYDLQLRLARDRDEKVEGLHEPTTIDVLVDRKRVHRFSVKAPRNEAEHSGIDSHLIVRLPISAGPHEIGVTFPNESSSLLEQRRQPFDAAYNRHRHPRRTPAVFEVSIAGPFDPQGPGETPSRRAIFGDDDFDGVDETEAARRILRRLARLAYRRPIDDADLLTPMKFFAASSEAEGLEAGIEAALASILVNPNFLLRIERDAEGIKPGKVHAVGEIDLASRLSYFLWSSQPDAVLLDLAEAGKLRMPGVLEDQVRRMLEDERSQSLVTNFAAQWLYLRNLDSVTPDLRLFPDFDDNLRQAFRRETELLFGEVMRNDLSVLTLLQCDHTYLNDRLATHYEIPHVQGSHFRRVALDPSTHRGGILRHGSILTVTSYATRTSPTIRGNWILHNVLGTPPPPPPPNVPALGDKADFEKMTVRERLAVHRSNPACASCHDLIDPVGFALDNFDALGRWRELDDGLAIDVSGNLPDGQPLAGVDDLESSLLKRPEMFVGTMVEKLMTFALGRGMTPADGPAIRRVVRHAATNEYRFSSLINAIVMSEPFQMRVSGNPGSSP